MVNIREQVALLLSKGMNAKQIANTLGTLSEVNVAHLIREPEVQRMAFDIGTNPVQKELEGMHSFGAGSTVEQAVRNDQWSTLNISVISKESGVPRDKVKPFYDEYRKAYGNEYPNVTALSSYVRGRFNYETAENPSDTYTRADVVAPPNYQDPYDIMASFGISRKEVDETARKYQPNNWRSLSKEQVLKIMQQEYINLFDQPLSAPGAKEYYPLGQRAYNQPGWVARAKTFNENKDWFSDVTLMGRGDKAHPWKISATFQSNLLPMGTLPNTIARPPIGTGKTAIEEDVSSTKKVQREQLVYPVHDLYEGNLDVTAKAYIDQGNIPARGIIMPVMYTHSDLNAEGTSLEKKRNLYDVHRIPMSFDITEGRNMEFRIGQEWNLDKGQKVIPYEGATPIDFGGGGTIKLIEAYQGNRLSLRSGKPVSVAAYRTIFEQRQDIIKMHPTDKGGANKVIPNFVDPSLMEDLYGYDALMADYNLTKDPRLKEMAESFRALGTRYGENTPASDYARMQLKYPENLPGQYFMNNRERIAEALDISQEDAEEFRWSADMRNRKLYEFFTDVILPEHKTIERHAMLLNETTLPLYEDVIDPSMPKIDLGDGNFKVFSYPEETYTFPKTFRTFGTQGGGNSSYVPPDVLAAMRAGGMGYAAEQLEKQGISKKEAAQSIRNAALYNASEEISLTGTIEVTEEIAGDIIRQANTLAVTAGYDKENIPDSVYTHYIHKALQESEYGDKILMVDDTAIAAPSAMKKFAAGGKFEDEEVSAYLGRASALIAGKASGFLRDEDKQRLVASQEVISRAETIDRLLKGTNAGKFSTYNILASAEDISSDELVIPDKDIARSLGIGVRSKKFKQISQQMAAGTFALPTLMDRDPMSSIENYNGGWFRGISHKAYKLRSGTSEMSDNVLAATPATGSTSSDNDGDMVRQIFGAFYAKYNDITDMWELRDEWNQGQRFVTDAEVTERRERVESYGRPTGKRERRNSKDEMEKVRLDNMVTTTESMQHDRAVNNARVKQAVGPDYNTLKSLSVLSEHYNQGQSAEAMFRTIYGKEQTPQPLSEHGRKLMDLLGSARRTGYNLKDPSRAKYPDWQTVRGGFGGLYLQSVEEAAQAKEISPEMMNLFLPEELRNDEATEKLISDIRSAPEGPDKYQLLTALSSAIIKTGGSPGQLAMKTAAGALILSRGISPKKGDPIAPGEQGITTSDFELLEEIDIVNTGIKKAVTFKDNIAKRMSTFDVATQEQKLQSLNILNPALRKWDVVNQDIQKKGGEKAMGNVTESIQNSASRETLVDFNFADIQEIEMPISNRQRADVNSRRASFLNMAKQFYAGGRVDYTSYMQTNLGTTSFEGGANYAPDEYLLERAYQAYGPNLENQEDLARSKDVIGKIMRKESITENERRFAKKAYKNLRTFSQLSAEGTKAYKFEKHLTEMSQVIQSELGGEEGKAFSEEFSAIIGSQNEEISQRRSAGNRFLQAAESGLGVNLSLSGMKTYESAFKLAGVPEAKTSASGRNQAQIEEDLAKVTVQLTEQRRKTFESMQGASEKELVDIDKKLVSAANREYGKLYRETRANGGLEWTSDFLTSETAQNFRKTVGGAYGYDDNGDVIPPGGGGRGPGGGTPSGFFGRRGKDAFDSALLNAKRMITPFSPEGAMIRYAWNAGMNEMKEGLPVYMSRYQGEQQLASMVGPYTGYEAQSVGGKYASYLNRRQDALAAGGQASYQAWGWTQQGGGEGLHVASGVYGPALAIGVGAKIGISELLKGTAYTGAAAPIALGLGLTAATVATGVYGYNIAEQTPENYDLAYQDTQNFREGNFFQQGAGLWRGVTRELGSVMRGDQTLVDRDKQWGNNPLFAPVRAVLSTLSGRKTQSMTGKAEDIYGGMFADQTTQERAASIRYQTNQLMEDPGMAVLGRGNVQAAIQSVMSYNNVESGSELGGKFAKQIRNIAATGQGAEIWEQSAAILGMGTGGAQELYNRYSMPRDTNYEFAGQRISGGLGLQGQDLRTFQAALGQYGQLRQYGATAPQIEGLALRRGEMTGQVAASWGRAMSMDQQFISQAVMGNAPQGFAAQTGMDLTGQYQLQTLDRMGFAVGTTGELSNLVQGVGMMGYPEQYAGSSPMPQPQMGPMNQSFNAWDRIPNVPAGLPQAKTGYQVAQSFRNAYPNASIFKNWNGNSLWGAQEEMRSFNQGVENQAFQWKLDDFQLMYGQPAFTETQSMDLAGLAAFQAGGQVQTTNVPTKITAQNIGGAVGAQMGASGAQIAIRRVGGLGGTYGGETFKGSFQWQTETMEMQREQFYEGQALQSAMTGAQRGFQLQQRGWQAEDIQTAIGRGRTSFGWQAADIETGYARNQTQMGWRVQDLQLQQQQATTGDEYKSWQMGFQQRQTTMQRGWQEEDWSLNRQQNQMQFGWQMEDFEENIRFSSGRQRKNLVKQQERATISQNITTERMETQEDRTREQWQMQDEAFEKQKEQIEKEKELRENNWELQFERLAEQTEWMNEDYEKQKERFGTTRAWQEEDWAKQVDRFNATNEYEDVIFGIQEARQANEIENYEESLKMRTEQLEEERKLFQFGVDAAAAAQGAQNELTLSRASQLAAELATSKAIMDNKEGYTALESVASKMGDTVRNGYIQEWREIIDQIYDLGIFLRSSKY